MFSITNLPNDIKIEEIFEVIRKDAEKRRNDAGLAGEMGDGGAWQLEHDVMMFQCGMEFFKDGTIPQSWKGYIYNIRRDKDPEYEEFKRLAEKFGTKIPQK